MTKERASIFGDDAPDLDVGGFQPKPRGKGRPDPAAVRRVAEESGFPSREASAPAAADRPRRGRIRTGRDKQLNLKVSADYLNRFFTAADQLGVSQAEAFERAVDALERELAV